MSNWKDAKKKLPNEDSPETWRSALYRPGIRFSIESSPISGLRYGVDMMQFLGERDYPKMKPRHTLKRKKDTYCISPTVSRPVSMRLDESLLFLISSGVEEIPSLSTITSSSKKERRERITYGNTRTRKPSRVYAVPPFGNFSRHC